MSNIYKLIIIGSGPAGYTAGIYSARAELKPIIFSGPNSGGQLMNTSIIENWPGNKEGILGPQLMMNMREQAVKFGAKIIDETVGKVDFSGEPFKVNNLETETVIIATGAESIRLHIPGEDQLFGRGVAVCAVCDAPFYKNKTVAVLGGGDSACEDALTLTKFAKKVYLVHRRDQLRASRIMSQRVKNNPKIEILWNSAVTEILGENRVEAVKINNEKEIKLEGVFLALGHRPASDLFKGKIQLNERGYIMTNFQFSKSNFQTMTSVEGVFAAGDVVDYRYQQAITAAGMGCQAALDAEKYLTNE
ncbi:MAG: thioredoxin-disulfide reductase [Candidatus Beckwithbacteria bacterium]|nr:thioredoxin-disulfide reductase [Candidatus Beckwithbacteria bacterium]